MNGRFVLDARSVINVHAATRAGLCVLVLGVPVPMAPAAAASSSDHESEIELAGAAGTR